MTNEEKAEEITKRDFCNKLCGEKECSYTVQACPMAQYVYLGSFLGLAEGRKEKQTIIDKQKANQCCNVSDKGLCLADDRLQLALKEIAELKAKLEKIKTCSRCMSNNKDIEEYPCKNCYKDGVHTKWH